MSAAGLRNPNAIRVVALMLVLTDSIRPFLIPVIKGGVNGVEVLADFAAEFGEFGNAAPGGPFQRPVEASLPSRPLSWNGSRSPAFRRGLQARHPPATCRRAESANAAPPSRPWR